MPRPRAGGAAPTAAATAEPRAVEAVAVVRSWTAARRRCWWLEAAEAPRPGKTPPADPAAASRVGQGVWITAAAEAPRPRAARAAESATAKARRARRTSAATARPR